MGVRADFYVRTSIDDPLCDGMVGTAPVRWIGSMGNSGNPAFVSDFIIGAFLHGMSPLEDVENQVRQYLLMNECGTVMEMGWPWPWKDSTTTDMAYILYEDDDRRIEVDAYYFGTPIDFDRYANSWERQLAGDMPTPPFPDMSEHRCVTMALRSGVTAYASEDSNQMQHDVTVHAEERFIRLMALVEEYGFRTDPENLNAIRYIHEHKRKSPLGRRASCGICRRFQSVESGSGPVLEEEG